MAQRLLVLGATGLTGRQLIARALERGHAVTAFVRQPDKLPQQHARLRLVPGDILANPDSVAAALEGQDAVISALGRGQRLRSDHLIERSLNVIVPAMEQRGPRRLIVTSAFGVGDTIELASPLLRLLFRTLLRDIYADKAVGEAIVRASSLEWTLVNPVYLTNGARTGRYDSGERLRPKGFAKISRGDVADFLIRCVEDPGSIRKRFVLTGDS